MGGECGLGGTHAPHLQRTERERVLQAAGLVVGERMARDPAVVLQVHVVAEDHAAVSLDHLVDHATKGGGVGVDRPGDLQQHRRSGALEHVGHDGTGGGLGGLDLGARNAADLGSAGGLTGRHEHDGRAHEPGLGEAGHGDVGVVARGEQHGDGMHGVLLALDGPG